MAVPVVQSFTSAIATGTSVAVAYPSGIAAGDLLILIASCDLAAATTNWDAATNIPSGFNWRFTQLRAGAQCAVWYRIATGSESGNVTVNSSSSVNLIAWCIRLTGAASTSPISQLGSGYSSSASSHAVTGITTTQDDCLAFVLLAFDGGDAGSFGYSGTGWTKSDQQYSPSTGANDASATWGTKDQSTAGATGTCTITTAVSDDAVGRQFVVAPAPPPMPIRRHRLARPVDINPHELRGRIKRHRTIVQDFVEPVWVPRRRDIRPVDIDPQALTGRTTRRSFLAADFQQAPPHPARRIKQRPPAPEVLRGRITRRYLRVNVFPSEIALLVDLDISNDSELALRADLDVLARETYRVILRDSSTGEETILGEGTSLSGIAIADGHYVVRVEADGHLWREARFRTEYAFSIEGGELVAALPPIVALQASVVGSSIYVTWRIDPLSGTTAPADFAVWVDNTSPVDTSGAAAATAAWNGVGGYFVELAAAPTSLYVAVAARLGAQVGPVSEVAVTGDADPGLSSPSGVSGRIPNGDWTVPRD